MKFIGWIIGLLLFASQVFSQTAIKTRENFTDLPIDSLIIEVYPSIERGFTMASFRIDLTWENGFESKSKFDSNEWPANLKGMINASKNKKDFKIEFKNLSIKDKNSKVVSLDPFFLFIDPSANYPAKTKQQNTKAESFGKTNYPAGILIPKNIAGKLLIERANKTFPLKNVTVDLFQKGIAVQRATTDQNGDFTFATTASREAYEIVVPKAQEGIETNDKLILSRQNGIIIRNFNRNAKGDFVHEILPADMVMLNVLEEEDPLLNLDLIVKNNITDKEVKVVKSITFDFNSAEVKIDAKKDLDKLCDWLKKNPSYKLKILGYTDSKGDKEVNLKLSERRVQAIIAYLCQQGIDKLRLQGNGMGESNILNRCIDDVDCSEKEHALNRRVEFLFVK